MTDALTFDARARELMRTALRRGFWPVVGGCVVALAAGCDESWHPPPAPLDCSQNNSYDVIETYEPGELGGVHNPTAASVTWYGYGDPTADGSFLGENVAGQAPPAVPIDGDRCGSTQALRLEASGFNDYGSGFGDYNPGSLMLPCTTNAMVTCPIDASGYEGLAFWARSPGETTKGVTIALNDANTSYAPGIKNTCVSYSTDAGVNTYTVTTPANNSGTTVSTGSTVASPQPPANACGNTFNYVLMTTADWQLYKIPFSAFYQSPQPDRIPTGFDPSTFSIFSIIVPEEAHLDLWIDDLGFYPKKLDGGAL